MERSVHRLESASRSGYVLLGLGATLLGAALPSLVAELGQGYAALSGLLVATAAGTTVSYVLGNRFVDRLSAPTVLGVGFAIFLLGALPLPFAPVYQVWLGAVFVAGFGLSLVDVSGARIVNDLHPESRGRALNALNAFFAVGAVVGPPMVALAGLLHLLAGWAWLGGGAVAAFALASLLSAQKGPARPAAAPPAPAAPAGRQARPVWLWLLTGAMFVYTASEAGFGSWFAAFAHVSARVPTWEAALFITVFWAGFIPSRFIASGRMGLWKLEHLAMSGALLGAAGEAVVALFGSSATAGLIGGFVAGFGLGPCFPVLLALAGQGAPGREGWTFGRLYSALAFAFLIAPWLEGRLFDGSPALAMAVMALSAAAVAGVIALYRRPSPEAPSQKGTAISASGEGAGAG